MDGQGLQSGELSQIQQPEKPLVPKPQEIKAPELKPMEQTEQTMVARIDKDGDPDQVLRDIAKPETPSAAPVNEAEERVKAARPKTIQGNPTATTQPVTETQSVTDTALGKEELIQATTPDEGQQTAQKETMQAVAPKYEIKPVGSAEEVNQRIRKQVTDAMKALTMDDLEKRRLELKSRPQIGSVALTDSLVGVDQQSIFKWVPTDKIVGRTWETPDSWASEIEARKGRVVRVAEEIIGSNGNPEVMEHVFHIKKAHERIKLTAIDGPAGPMYYVDDGTHRVSASMVAGLSEIPCDVKAVSYPLEQIATNDNEVQVEDWRIKIELGLIDGQIQDSMDSHGKKIKKLVVRSKVLPWIRTTSQHGLLTISRIYENLYPGSLDNLKVPREALIDPVANNYFMLGRWEEWLRQKQN